MCKLCHDGERSCCSAQFSSYCVKILVPCPPYHPHEVISTHVSCQSQVVFQKPIAPNWLASNSSLLRSRLVLTCMDACSRTQNRSDSGQEVGSTWWSLLLILFEGANSESSDSMANLPLAMSSHNVRTLPAQSQ